MKRGYSSPAAVTGGRSGIDVSLRRTLAALLVLAVFQATWVSAQTAMSSGSVPTDPPASVPRPVRIVTMPSGTAPPIGGVTSAGVQVSGVTTPVPAGFTTNINPGATLLLPEHAAALAAFNRAAAVWESHISDPIVVNIDADMAPLPAGVLGSTSSVLLQDDFDTVRNAMVDDAADEADDGIVAHLPTFAQFSALVPDVEEGTFGLSGQIVATKANFKALGYAGLDDEEAFGVSDGSITFSTNFNFDFDNSDGVSAGTWDFETIAVHEIGHALGFVSRVDYVDFLLSDLSGTFEGVDPEETVDLGVGALDMFCFQDDEPGKDPETEAEFTTHPRLLAPGNARVFDQIDDHYDSDAESRMSEGRRFGDGRQASHWKDNNLTSVLIGVMDPTFAPRQYIPLSDSDLRAFDLIGYEITVPEPATLMVLAIGGTGMMLRRGRARFS